MFVANPGLASVAEGEHVARRDVELLGDSRDCPPEVSI
jgi:hypothetical protein